MNKEDYVSLEVAKLLREKGFDEQCRYTYCGESEEDIGVSNNKNSSFPQDIYSIPTLYEAQKWLREEHGVYVTIISSPLTWLYGNNEGASITHFPVITYRDSEGKIKMSYHQGMNDSEYEKAFNLAMLESLKLI